MALFQNEKIVSEKIAENYSNSSEGSKFVYLNKTYIKLWFGFNEFGKFTLVWKSYNNKLNYVNIKHCRFS